MTTSTTTTPSPTQRRRPPTDLRFVVLHVDETYNNNDAANNTASTHQQSQHDVLQEFVDSGTSRTDYTSSVNNDEETVSIVIDTWNQAWKRSKMYCDLFFEPADLFSASAVATATSTNAQQARQNLVQHVRDNVEILRQRIVYRGAFPQRWPIIQVSYSMRYLSLINCKVVLLHQPLEADSMTKTTIVARATNDTRNIMHRTDFNNTARAAKPTMTSLQYNYSVFLDPYQFDFDESTLSPLHLFATVQLDRVRSAYLAEVLSTTAVRQGNRTTLNHNATVQQKENEMCNGTVSLPFEQCPAPDPSSASCGIESLFPFHITMESNHAAQSSIPSPSTQVVDNGNEATIINVTKNDTIDDMCIRNDTSQFRESAFKIDTIDDMCVRNDTSPFGESTFSAHMFKTPLLKEKVASTPLASSSVADNGERIDSGTKPEAPEASVIKHMQLCSAIHGHDTCKEYWQAYFETTVLAHRLQMDLDHSQIFRQNMELLLEREMKDVNTLLVLLGSVMIVVFMWAAWQITHGSKHTASKRAVLQLQRSTARNGGAHNEDRWEGRMIGINISEQRRHSPLSSSTNGSISPLGIDPTYRSTRTRRANSQNQALLHEDSSSPPPSPCAHLYREWRNNRSSRSRCHPNSDESEMTGPTFARQGSSRTIKEGSASPNVLPRRKSIQKIGADTADSSIGIRQRPILRPISPCAAPDHSEESIAPIGIQTPPWPTDTPVHARQPNNSSSHAAFLNDLRTKVQLRRPVVEHEETTSTSPVVVAAKVERPHDLSKKVPILEPDNPHAFIEDYW